MSIIIHNWLNICKEEFFNKFVFGNNIEAWDILEEENEEGVLQREF